MQTGTAPRSAGALQVLVLAETEVLPWKEDVQRVMGRIIGRQLQLGPGGAQAQDAFSTQAWPMHCYYYYYYHTFNVQGIQLRP